MSVWILTIGSSDVQLNTKAHWQNLLRNVKSQLDNRGFTPTDGTDNRFLVHARVMGTVYSQPPAKEYWGDLVFPLLDNFVGQIHNEVIEQIILILTDQAAVFSPEDRRSQHCPYWQDTCTLEPLLTTYLKEKFPKTELKLLLLQPNSATEGLDDWDYVLKLVQEKFSKFDFPNKSTIYVSHQAGTPAISSAVQFSILAKFGERVEFLVSSERNSKLTRILDGSTYLRGIRLQEANALLKRYDYEGVKSLLSPYWEKSATPLEQKISELLQMAIQWNRAEFKDFGDLAKDKIEGAKERIDEPWAWWIGYESAYLAVVRLEQENTVEALFHSFRAAEGLICKWAEWQYEKHIDYKKDKETDLESPLINRSIITELPHYLKNQFNNKDKTKNQESVGLYSFNLYELLRQSRKCEKDPRINVVWKIAAKWRNKYFHQLLGLQAQTVFDAWDTQHQADWEAKILDCLNFIIEPKPPFTSLKEASLMSQVHKELDKAIEQYEHTT
ncbi:MAG TPA: hypothetical protein DD379_18510 [Cyanobacteria bacterium UBA11162]|nr:hypothetical protein [Cyanobacteria bacterium UBA11162]